MPFSLDNEKIKNHLQHLGITAQQLRHMFATETDYQTVAREYLGLSAAELEAFIEPTELTQDTVESAFGYSGDSFVSTLSMLASFMETTDFEAQTIRDLLYQNLYIEPSDHSVVEDGREYFYINTGLTENSNSIYTSGYVSLSTDENSLEWNTLISAADDASTDPDDDSSDRIIPLAWFDRVSRFLRLAQKTGLSVADLDHIIRYCCLVDGVPTINSDTVVTIAQVIFLHKTLELPIERIVAILTTLSYTGRTNEDLPQDQFNRIFNLPCVSVDKNYFHITDVTGDVPIQYEDSTYNDYSQIIYYSDLFSDDNDSYRKRLRHTLGFTETDLINITERLEFEEVIESSFWEDIDNEWEMLNVLFRIHALANALDVHFLELFTMLDLLELDPFIGRMDPHTYFIYAEPSTQKSFDILMGENASDRLWLFESLVALNKWMKEFGYSAEVLWGIVNGAPRTDKEEKAQKQYELEIYNGLLESFNGFELKPNTFEAALSDARAARFAFNMQKGLFKTRCGYKHNKPVHHLIKYKKKESQELVTEFINQLDHIQKNEFIGLSLQGKLEEKIFSNLVIRDLIDGHGKILVNELPELHQFEIEEDFNDINLEIYGLFHSIYVDATSQRLNVNDEIEVQLFKSDLKELGLNETQARELYDTLIFNGYIDDQGFAQNSDLFIDPVGTIDLSTGIKPLTKPVYDHLQRQLDKFEASRVQINPQMFEALELKPVALNDLMTNLKMNRYIDENNFIIDKMRIVGETLDTMEHALQFYPKREAIFQVLEKAIASDKDQYLKIDKTRLLKIADKTVSRWVFDDLQSSHLQGSRIQSEAKSFFINEEEKTNFNLRLYFDQTQTNIVFDHIKSIIKYAQNYHIKDDALIRLDFEATEIIDLKNQLQVAGFINDENILYPEHIAYFMAPENAANFSIQGYEDYDKEIFFLLYDNAQFIDSSIKSIDQAMKQLGEIQQNTILEKLQGVLGIDLDAVKALSKAIFKTEDNLHTAWLQPLLEDANALGILDELPGNMHYTQAVKRIRQLALLVNKLQLDNNEIDIALEDQKLVAKFPEDLILPDGIVSIDALLETDEFVYLFKDDYYWIYQSEDYTLIDKKEVVAGIEEDDDLIDLQKENEEQQKRLKEDPIRQLFDKEDLDQIDAAFIDRLGTWCVVSGEYHYLKYSSSDVWDQRDNNFGQVDNDFDNIEMIDTSYVNSEGHLFLFCNDKYVRYSDVDFTLDPVLQASSEQPDVDQGYPKSIAEDWNDENQPIQLPSSFNRDLGPFFDGTDEHSYAFNEDTFISSADQQIRFVAEKWGHSEYDFGHADHIDAAMASNGNYLIFLEDKVVKYAASIELSNLQPEENYPKPIYEEFSSLPDKFVAGIDAALHGIDDNIYLFRDDDCATIDGTSSEVTEAETNTIWGIVANDIADIGKVDAAFVGLDGRTYLFSGSRYVRYSTADYSQVDDGFPRDIVEDWEGLTEVTGAFVLANKTYLFGTNVENEAIYVRYSTVHKEEEQDYLEVDEEDPNARSIETVLANRPDVDEIEVFPATVDAEFWSLPESLTEDNSSFQIDAVMNGPEGKVYLFYGDNYIEHDHANRWWSEPKVMSEQWDRAPVGIDSEDSVIAAFMGEDGHTYLFFDSRFLRFSDSELCTIDNGFPRSTKTVWGKVRNNIERTGQVDATLLVESRWEEQDDNGQLVDRVEMHTYLFSGDQMFRYEADNYETVEQGYPRSISRLKDEPRFRGLEVIFPDGIDAAFADQRQIYLFKKDSFHVVVGDEDNYKHYEDDSFSNIQAVTQQGGVTYVLDSDNLTWSKLNHLEDRVLNKTDATPRVIEKALESLTESNLSDSISAVLHGTDGKSYVFTSTQFYDVTLERIFDIDEVWGRSRNPIHDKETIDAAFVGRDGITYIFSDGWFVQYDTQSYVDQTVVYPPRRIADKWSGLRNVALAYVWKEETYLFERPDSNGNFRYLRYSKDSYERPDSSYPRQGDKDFWEIPQSHLQEGFDTIDTIFVQKDNLIFISDQKFISFNLEDETWSFPQPLELIYNGIPFNKTDFQDLKSGFVGTDDTVYFFNQQCFVSYDSITDTWTSVDYIKDHWGLQNNIFENGVDVAYVGSDGATYLFGANEYVKYSSSDYRYVDPGYPKETATYLRDEPAFAFMSKEFQQHLDKMEADTYTPFFNGIVDNGRCLYFFTQDTLFAGGPDKYVEYAIDGLGSVDNNFTSGEFVDAAFVDTDNEQTYLFSGEQYIRYTGDNYRYIDQGYPKIISESLADDLGIDSLPEEYCDGIDAAFYISSTNTVFFNERRYLNINSDETLEGNINDVWGKIDNTFVDTDENTIDGAYVDMNGALHIFKGQQFIRYSDTKELFALNPYNESRYVDEEYPLYITDQWPQIDTNILVDEGVDTVFKFENEIHFHTDGLFVTYDLDLDDHDDEVDLQVLVYRWGEWSDYLLSDIHALSRFKDLGQRFTGGDITLTELVSGANGEVKEPFMHFAAIFGFEKEEVRWLKQRNAFLANRVNVFEEDFQVELVLRLYEILSTTQRIRVDVSALYNDVWLNLYGSLVDYAAAATNVYDLLVSVDCNNNYETLVKQIDNELNTIKRDALVPYVIANDDEVSTTRGLYQKLLIDIQMGSCAETSRIKEATAAVQLYLHRYFVNLENIDLDSSDQEAARRICKDRWEWLQNYRVWEANRKVFLYPENYIRPELRDTKTPSFEALEQSLSQGELTEDTVEEAYYAYLDAFTEVSELTIAGGYVYDEPDSSDKKLLLFGRTRTDPMRYFYRFGTFVGGDSDAAIWDAWLALDIPIEATRVEPVFAFNRVFVFWTTIEESSEDPSSAEVKTTSTDDDTQTVSSEGNSQFEVKIFYSFYNLNKRWTQPRALQTEFNGSSKLITNYSYEDLDLFVENSTKLTQNSNDHEYENIYISIRMYVGTATYLSTSTPFSIPIYNYAAYNLTPELYSQEADTQTIDNRGQDLFTELFNEGSIEEDNVVMLNYNANSVDGPWFAYNHNGCGFLVKPDTISLSNDIELEAISSDDTMLMSGINAAVQIVDGGDVIYFLDNQTYVTRSTDGTFSDPEAIGSRWGIDATSEMQISGTVDSAFAASHGERTRWLVVPRRRRAVVLSESER